MPSNAPKDTLTDLTSKAYENSTENKQGKISSTPATYSTDLTGNGESAGMQGNIKYFEVPSLLVHSRCVNTYICLRLTLER